MIVISEIVAAWGRAATGGRTPALCGWVRVAGAFGRAGRPGAGGGGAGGGGWNGRGGGGGGAGGGCSAGGEGGGGAAGVGQGACGAFAFTFFAFFAFLALLLPLRFSSRSSASGSRGVTCAPSFHSAAQWQRPKQLRALARSPTRAWPLPPALSRVRGASLWRRVAPLEASCF